VTANSDYVGDPAVSTPIQFEVELEGDAPEEALRELVERVDRIAEIPNSLRRGTEVRLASIRMTG
jgi:putative redox protein